MSILCSYPTLAIQLVGKATMTGPHNWWIPCVIHCSFNPLRDEDHEDPTDQCFSVPDWNLQSVSRCWLYIPWFPIPPVIDDFPMNFQYFWLPFLCESNHGCSRLEVALRANQEAVSGQLAISGFVGPGGMHIDINKHVLTTMLNKYYIHCVIACGFLLFMPSYCVSLCQKHTWIVV